MRQLREGLRQQIEIIGLVADCPATYSAYDLAELLGCSSPSIGRHITDLNGGGIPIHAVRSKGFRIDTSLRDDQLIDLILQYIGLSHTETDYDKATAVLVSQLKEKSLATIVLIQRCIDRSLSVMIDYQKSEQASEKRRVIHPVLIFQSEGTWRLLAMQRGEMKQFLLGKILKVHSPGPQFTKPKVEDIHALFKNSWRSWLGPDSISIKLRIEKGLGETLRQRPVIENQTIGREKDGRYLLNAEVNSLDEVARWVVARGGEVVAISPTSLVKMVIELSEKNLRAHKHSKQKTLA